MQFIDYKRLSVNKFSKEIGVSNSYLGKMFKSNGSIGHDKIENILRTFPEVNADWLLTGRGQMIKEEKLYVTNNLKSYVSEPSSIEVYKSITDRLQDSQIIPLYGARASAGLVALFENYGDVEPIDYLRIPGVGKCDGSIFVTGDSMYPILKSGDIVAYRFVNDIKQGIAHGNKYVVIFNWDDEVIVSVKYVQKSDKGEDFITLVSHNQHYSTREIHKKEIIKMMIVKASVRLDYME